MGYGLDRAVEVLRAAPGSRRAFLDVSGDCFALGAPPGEAAGRSGWPIQTARARVIAVDPAPGCGARDVVQHGVGGALRAGRTGPRHGPGHRLARVTGRRQVTVVARTGIEADALSTAMLVSARAVPGVLRSYAFDW